MYNCCTIYVFYVCDHIHNFNKIKINVYYIQKNTMSTRLLLFTLICVSVMATSPPTIPAAWIDEAEGWLKDMIKIDTSSLPVPSGKEWNLIPYITNILTRENIPYQTISVPFPSDPSPFTMPILIARKAGTTNDEIMTAGHSDTAQLGNMPDPLLGEVVDGFIYGRGAIDMKHKIVYDLANLVWSYRLGITHQRGILFAVFPGEELGMMGAGLASSIPSIATQFQNVKLAIDEAAGMTVNVYGKNIMPVGIGEKGMCQFLISVDTNITHGSGALSIKQDAPLRLSQALLNAYNTIMPPYYTDNNRLFLQDIQSISHNFKTSSKRLSNRITYFQEMYRIRHVLDDNYAAATLFLPTLSLYLSPIELKAYNSFNTIPGHAEATVVFMVPSTENANNCEIAKTQLIDAIDDSFVAVTRTLFEGTTQELTDMIGHGTYVDPNNNEVVHAMNIIKSDVSVVMPDVSVVHGYCPALSDCFIFQNVLNIPCINFAPVRMVTGDSLATLAHSDHEHISESGFREGLQVYFRTIYHLTETAPSA